jgi:hypothetical protein
MMMMQGVQREEQGSNLHTQRGIMHLQALSHSNPIILVAC